MWSPAFSPAAAPALLYQDLVRDKQIALAAGADATFPGGKYPGLFLFYLVPAMGKTLAENEKALDGVLDELQEGAGGRRHSGPRQDQNARRPDPSARQQLRPGATSRRRYYANYGDWRKLFTDLDDIDKVTADDVQRVAAQYFTDRTGPWLRLSSPASRRSK